MKLVPCTTISVPPLAGPLSGDRLTSVGRGTSRKVAGVFSAWFPAVSVACGVMTTVALSSVGTGAVKRYLQGASWGPGATVHTSSTSDIVAIVAPREPRKPSPSLATSATVTLVPAAMRLRATGLSMLTVGACVSGPSEVKPQSSCTRLPRGSVTTTSYGTGRNAGGNHRGDRLGRLPGDVAEREASVAEPFVVDAPAGVSAAENEPLSDSVAAAIVSKR